MSTEQLQEHLRFFEELGIDGMRLEREWRSRTAPRETAKAGAVGSAQQHLVTPTDDRGNGRLPGDRGRGESSGPADAVADAINAVASNAGGGGPSGPPTATAVGGNASPVAIYASQADALAAVMSDIGPDCSRCKLHTLGRRQVVFGVGNPNADLMFVGEAPGADEDIQGEPFVGRAGQLLTKIIEAIDLRREDVYIANVIKCRPPQNRNPEPDEVEQCEPFLFRQIDIIKPKVIVALGKFAAQSLLRTAEPITRIRGREYTYRDAILMPTYHPAYLLRNPSAKREVWEDMKRVRAILTQGA
jgi:DNA polymerase